MKIVSRAINMIAFFMIDENIPRPHLFKMVDDRGESVEVRVGRIIRFDRKKIAGVDSYVYQCQSIIGDIEKRYELKYIIPECRWLLYKI